MDEATENIEHFKDALIELLPRDGKNTWPIAIDSVTPLFMDLFLKELLTDIDELTHKGFSEVDISRLFKRASRIIRLIVPLVQGMRGIEAKERREYVSLFLSMAEHLKYGDLCNRDKRNIVLSPSELHSTIDSSTLNPANKDTSRLVHRLCGILWAYAETVFFRTHGLSKEFHGPYKHTDYSEEILIRDFFCLRPVGLWDECSSLKYKSVRVITAYEDVEMSIDIYNHLFIKEGKDYVNSLKYYYIEADGRPLSVDEANSLCVTVSQIITSITAGLEKWDYKQLAEKYADILWFSKKALRDALHLDWRVPPAAKERIQTGQLSTKYQNLSLTESRRLLRLAF